jgi:sulfur carrier protein ThiS
MQVRIVQLGRGVYPYAAEPGATVAAGLEAAGITPGTLDVRVNGRPASLDQALSDGDLVTIVPMIKGGQAPEHA